MKQGQDLKEVVIDFILKDNLSINIAKKFILKIIKKINMKLVSFAITTLPPGFDVLCSIKESCIYLGYWGEYKFVHLIVSSCKKFDEKKIIHLIKKSFKLEADSKIDIKIYKNTSIKQLVNKLCH